MVRDCPKCGLVNPPEALRCDCGYDFSKKQGQAQPPAYLALAVLTLLLSLPFGVLAIVLSRQVHPRFISGDLAGARRASMLTGAMCVMGLILSIVVVLLTYPF